MEVSAESCRDKFMFILVEGVSWGHDLKQKINKLGGEWEENNFEAYLIQNIYFNFFLGELVYGSKPVKPLILGYCCI